MLALTPVQATILAAIIGGVAALISTALGIQLRRRRRRNALRHALYSEIELASDPVKSIADQDPSSTDTPVHTSLPMTVYKSNASKLGLLSKTERKAIIAYYGAVEVAREQMDHLDDHAVRSEFFGTTASIVEEKHQDAMSELDDHL